MKKFIIIICLSFLGIPGLFSQLNSHLSIQYDISFGLGDLGEYISNPSFRGASAQYRYAVTDNVLVGFDVAWNVFYELKDYDTYTVGTASLSGVQYRTQNEVPLLACIDYLFLPDNALKPYIGLGLGTMYTERSTDMGTYRLMENPWHFALKPEAGILYELSSNLGLKLGIKYYNGFSSGELENQGYFTISTGLAFGM